MSLNIKTPEAHRLAQELTEARRAGLAKELLEIGRDCAARMSARTRRTDHGDLLYDDQGLPK